MQFSNLFQQFCFELFSSRIDTRCELTIYGRFCLQITVDAMRSEEDEISLQGIEFWSSLCDEEIDLSIEAAEVCNMPAYFLIPTTSASNSLIYM